MMVSHLVLDRISFALLTFITSRGPQTRQEELEPVDLMLIHVCCFRGKWCADCLMIDGLISHCGERLTNLWKRDEGGTGQYPPPTLHVSFKPALFLFNFDYHPKQFRLSALFPQIKSQ